MLKTYVFIDASNLFYGGEKSLGWKIDYEKLIEYLAKKYEVSKVYYFAGLDVHKFDYDYLNEDSIPLEGLRLYFENLLEKKIAYFDRVKIQNYLNRTKFYIKLKSFGYKLFLKPVKLYTQYDGSNKKKVNCDVEMAFYMMLEKDKVDRVVVLSGDGDFLPLLKHFKKVGKEVIILARGERTAKEIRLFAKSDFRDFGSLREILKY